MTRSPAMILLPVALLGGCGAAASARRADAPLRPATRVEPTPPAPVLVARAGRSPPAKASGRPLARGGAVNRARMPAAAAWPNAVALYPWREGALYRLSTAPEQVSDIALQPGEGLVSVAAGDTARWVIGDTVSGAGPARRTHVLVKPTASGLATNLVIATDRRVYHVAVESRRAGAMASIAWTYPDDPLLALQRNGAPSDQPVAAGIAVETLDFNYAIEGDNPSWRPLRAFDDGRQVFIEFPAALAQGEAPPLFVRSDDGRSELVNYRVRGRYYIVDRLFAAAELRLGERRQQVVRITRRDTRTRSRRNG